MKIIKVRDLEDCSDGSFIKSLLFDEAVTKEFIDYLGQSGELQYFPSFARPFYQINIQDKCVIKGVEGLKAARIKLHRNGAEDILAYFEQIVEVFDRDTRR